MCVGLCVLKQTAYPPRKKRRERKPNNQPSKLPPKPIVKLILQAKGARRIGRRNFVPFCDAAARL